MSGVDLTTALKLVNSQTADSTVLLRQFLKGVDNCFIMALT
jgi:hypothetical protein